MKNFISKSIGCLGICTILLGKLSALDLPEPLKGAEYEQVLKKYLNSEDEFSQDFEAHKFDKAAAFDKLYCEDGLPEACGDLGINYAFGLGVKRDISKAKAYIGYYSANSPMKFSAKEFSDLSVELIDKTSELDEKGAIFYLSNAFKKELDDCRSLIKWFDIVGSKVKINKDYIKSIGNRDSCFKALAYSIMLPCDMLSSDKTLCSKKGINDDIVGEILISEIAKNGLIDSKVANILFEYLDFIDTDEIKF